jgi:hypothetical protein
MVNICEWAYAENSFPPKFLGMINEKKPFI